MDTGVDKNGTVKLSLVPSLGLLKGVSGTV